ncbi:putative fatty acyl-CoA reductase CG5065 [Temnothorax longispinosus]|uniref:putative fatty acyl-CoA reductase CG5065 n=1 Tax=Temnothorax longispinosus TaxID=300112 RepID=UPI003A9A432E
MNFYSCVELETDIKMDTTNAQTNSGHAHDEVHPREGSINAFFAEMVIFLTGATGFLGKALLEKLLRSCPQVATIFVLIRPKKNKSVEQRLQDLLDNSVFDRIRSEFPGTLKKIFPVKGDVGLPELGLQPEDRDMLIKRVNIVFHSAATVRFNESLKVAVNLNTMGTDCILDLCRLMTNIISVVYVSTAYSNADRREIEESIYTTEVKPYTVIDICENLDDKTIGIIENKRLISKHPNTYTLTKGLAEQIIMSKGRNLPIAIVRPSIIGAAYQEPFPGWIDNVSGITGIMTEIGRGTIRSIVCNAKLLIDVVPVDFVVNTLICASWHNAMQHTNTIKIYNCTSSTVNPITWDKFGNIVRKHAIEYPSKYVMWYPGFTFRTNKFIHAIIVPTLHFFPAFIVDLILRVQGHKPMMLRVAKRFDRAAKAGEFFATNQWRFHSGNMTKLMKFVRASDDCDKFDVDITNLNWDMYLRQYMLGIRKYILKDNPDTLKNAQNRLSRLYWFHKAAQLMGIIIVLSVFLSLIYFILRISRLIV